MIAPSRGPAASAIATTATRTRLGPEPPGNGTLSSTVTWISTAARTAAVASRTRRMLAPRPAAGRGGAGTGGRGSGRARRSAGAGRGRGWGRARRPGREHGVPRVVPRRHDYHADDAQGAVVGERPDISDLRQRAGAGHHPGDHADRHPRD